MSWLPIIILSYLFFSLASLGDKIVLAGPSKPKSYTFYVGFLSIIVVLAIPFANFKLPDINGMMWIGLEAVSYLAGLYGLFAALDKYDVSRVMPTIGATQPIFIFVLTWAFWGPQQLSTANIVAFLLLLLGSLIISMDKNQKITGDCLTLTLLTSLVFSLDYVFSKFVFLDQPFLEGFIWMRILSFIMVLFFFFDKKFRHEIFDGQNMLTKKSGLIFISAQAAGGLANILQSFAISLAPIAYLAIMNSMKGIQYVFLFLLTLFISFFFPHILREETLKSVIIQKVVSIMLIAIGLAILVL